MSATEASAPPLPSEPFEAWQRATAALRAAEARKADHAEIVRLAEEVIRTRNALTMDRLQAGWNPPDDILRHLVGDEALLAEPDDTKATRSKATGGLGRPARAVKASPPKQRS